MSVENIPAPGAETQTAPGAETQAAPGAETQTIEQLQLKNQQTEQSNQQVLAENQRLVAELHKLQNPPQGRDDFDTEAKYNEYVIEQKVEDKLSKKEEEQNKVAQQQAAMAKLQRNWDQKILAFQTELPDYQKKLAAPQFIPGAAVPLIMESSIGPRIAYYLETNPQEGQKLALVSPQRLPVEMALLEVRLEKGIPGKVTTAHPPTPQQSGEGRTFKTDWSKIDDMDEFAKQRYKHLANKRS